MSSITRRGFIAVAGALALAGCGGTEGGGSAPAETAPEPLDLTGTWIAPGESEDSWQEAVIDGSTITVYWVSDNGDTKSLYWAGTYVAPDDAADTYSWDSENDHEQTDSAMLASTADTKTFTYDGGQLSWEVTALGTTTTVHADRQ